MFPWGTLAVGVVGATALALLRGHLTRNGRLAARPGGAAHADHRRWHVRDVSLVLVFVFAALALRLWNLEARVIDNDEPASFGFTGFESWARESDARLHPPLSPLLMSAAFSARALMSDARSVSVVAGILTVVLVFAALRPHGRTTATLAAAFAAFSPAMLHASQLARGYALAAALVLGTHVLLSRALRHGSHAAWIAYTAVGTLSLFTEYVTLVPICVEAVLVLASRSSKRAARLGVVTSLGSMLAISACFVPFALSTFHLGVGGPPRAPDGPWPALRQGLEMFGGAGGAALGAIGVLLPLVVLRAPSSSNAARAAAWRAGVATLCGVALLAVGGLITAMRARYVLPVLPLLIVACAAAASPGAARLAHSGVARTLALARRLGALAMLGAALLFLSHAALLPCYLRQSCAASEIARGTPLSATLAGLQRHPRAPVVVVPSWSIAEPCYRLIHKFPGRDSRRDCPARLCVENDQRAMFGLDADEFDARFPKLRAELGRVFVLVRGQAVAGPPSCSLDGHDESARLYRCEAPEQ